ncbi:putative ankyrin repeat protein RF_0381 [Haliotis asinina]
MNCIEWNSRTPAILAAGERHGDVVHLLVSKGANVSVVDDFGVNIFHSACQGGDVGLVKYILSLDKHDINGQVLCGATSVMLAAENGHRHVVEFLVGQGANVSLQDNSKNKILHFASRAGHVDVVKYVLSLPVVDINSRGWKDMTSAMMAAENGHKDVVELLFRNLANMSLKGLYGNTILHYASRAGHVDVVQYILSLSVVDINSRGRKDMTPVMMAVGKGHQEVVKLLVGQGASVSLQDNRGNNILHIACRGGHVEMVKYVLSQSMADINSRGWKTFTPVMVAAGKGRKEVVEFLVSKGADINTSNRAGKNILHLACRAENVELVKYILSKNMADINSRDKKQMTPILIAAMEGHEEVVQLLVNEGAKVSLRDKKANNILHLACRGGHVEVVKYILSQNMVDINSRNRKEMTPVMIAESRGHVQVVALLVRNGADRSSQDNIQ